MTRRNFIAVSLGAVGAAAVGAQRFSRDFSRDRAPEPVLRLIGRRRVAQGASVTPIEEPILWKASETAIIICDMWDDHYCISSVGRLEAMIPRMNRVTRGARALGVTIIHAPSSTMDFYEGTPQRSRVKDAPSVEPPVPIAGWCYLDPESEGALPIADEDPCDDLVGRERKRFYNRQHPDLEIAAEDGISDDGQEIFNYFEQHGIGNVVLMGVHTNKCVLGRPFGIRQQVRLGKNVVLARDLTDSMYDPRDEPFVSHERGTELVLEHIERYWCPTVLGDDLTRSAEMT